MPRTTMRSTNAIFCACMLRNRSSHRGIVATHRYNENFSTGTRSAFCDINQLARRANDVLLARGLYSNAGNRGTIVWVPDVYNPIARTNVSCGLIASCDRQPAVSRLPRLADIFRYCPG